MFEGHMSFLYVNCKKFPTNRFVRNFSLPPLSLTKGYYVHLCFKVGLSFLLLIRLFSKLVLFLNELSLSLSLSLTHTHTHTYIYIYIILYIISLSLSLSLSHTHTHTHTHTHIFFSMNSHDIILCYHLLLRLPYNFLTFLQ